MLYTTRCVKVFVYATIINVLENFSNNWSAYFFLAKLFNFRCYESVYILNLKKNFHHFYLFSWDDQNMVYSQLNHFKNTFCTSCTVTCSVSWTVTFLMILFNFLLNFFYIEQLVSLLVILIFSVNVSRFKFIYIYIFFFNCLSNETNKIN